MFVTTICPRQTMRFSVILIFALVTGLGRCDGPGPLEDYEVETSGECLSGDPGFHFLSVKRGSRVSAVVSVSGVPSFQFWLARFLAKLGISDILVQIRIRGSITLTNGSGSCYFRQWPLWRLKIFKTSFFKDKKSRKRHKTGGMKGFLTIFAWWEKDLGPDPYPTSY